MPYGCVTLSSPSSPTTTVREALRLRHTSRVTPHARLRAVSVTLVSRSVVTGGIRVTLVSRSAVTGVTLLSRSAVTGGMFSYTSVTLRRHRLLVDGILRELGDVKYLLSPQDLMAVEQVVPKPS
eukprot:7365038-Pyramimonas_sp.AAC.1